MAHFTPIRKSQQRGKERPQVGNREIKRNKALQEEQTAGQGAWGRDRHT